MIDSNNYKNFKRHLLFCSMVLNSYSRERYSLRLNYKRLSRCRNRKLHFGKTNEVVSKAEIASFLFSSLQWYFAGSAYYNYNRQRSSSGHHWNCVISNETDRMQTAFDLN